MLLLPVRPTVAGIGYSAPVTLSAGYAVIGNGGMDDIGCPLMVRMQHNS